MKDNLEAGKYLFLSGIRKPEYSGAINLFVEGYRKRDIQQIYSAFPSMARRTAFEDFPENVKVELWHLKFDPSQIKVKTEKSKDLTEPVRDWLRSLIVWGIVGLFFSSLAVGFVTIVSWIVNMIW
ncbi:hypothetical protein [Kordiimonas laminariae]|uniref:hypothetical protein n=1 Tax=Kordiimonas laminariae TaxID=2917717 RepID=UPI001FF4DB39|nr:hypothetical protein [Kordiimonas laminariae]MCK0070008.1 hypothetical protein [Kordiimonas laminariae]